MKNSTKNNLVRTNFAVKTEWERGFTGKLDILNTGETVQDWTIEFESAFEIEPGMIWGAEIVSRKGDRYTLKPVDYNDTINSQQNIEVVFNANKADGQIINPANIVFNDGASYEVASPAIDTVQPKADNLTES